MKKFLFNIILLFICFGAYAQQMVNLNFANATFPDTSTFSVEVQISTNTGSFNLGGSGFNFSSIRVAWNNPGTNAGEMVFANRVDLISYTANLNNQSGSGYIHYQFADLFEDATILNVTTTPVSIVRLTFNLGNGTNGTHDLLMSFVSGNTSILDDANNSINNGTLSSSNIASLPVELTYFTANPTQNQTELNWQTASEEQNEGFEVQKSLDGITFNALAWLSGQGTIFTPTNYQFVDVEQRNQVVYYRLKQIDFDGTTSFSDVISVGGDGNNVASLLNFFPNPANGQLNLQNNMQTKIIDLQGKTIFESNNFNTSVNVANWPKGIYIVQSIDEYGSINTFKKLLVQ